MNEERKPPRREDHVSQSDETLSTWAIKRGFKLITREDWEIAAKARDLDEKKTA